MRAYLLPSIKLTVFMLILSAGVYPLLVAGIGKLNPDGGHGVTVTKNGNVVSFGSVGQKFTDVKYFHGRPSVDHNAAGAGGSNKATSSPDYLPLQERFDTFLMQNPTVSKENIPAEFITALGSGLDPHLSPAAAYVQISDWRK